MKARGVQAALGKPEIASRQGTLRADVAHESEVGHDRAVAVTAAWN